MKKLHFLTQKITLIFILALYTVQVSAQDKITLTWRVDDPYKEIYLTATYVEPFTINWGDETIETTTNEINSHIEHIYTKKGEYEVVITSATPSCRFLDFAVFEQQVSKLNFSECSALGSIDCPDNSITNLNLSGLTALWHLGCNGNNIKYLDLSGCVNLKSFWCQDNNLTGLDLSHCSTINSVQCYNNQIQLSDLYNAHLLIDNNLLKYLGTQYLPNGWANIETKLFADQSVFNGIYTQYVVEIGGKPAPENNYSVIDGKLTFHTLGKYTVTMTNNAIISRPDYPAEVIVTIDVVMVGVSENESLNIGVYPNPTMRMLRVTSYELQVTGIEVFDVYGRNQKTESRMSEIGQSEIVINISDLSAGVYFVKIYTELGVVTKKIVKN